MSNGYIPSGCQGQVQWNSQCDPAGNCSAASSGAIGCDRSGGTCTTCGMGGFMSFAPPSDPPDPAHHTIVKFTMIAGVPVAVVCDPGPTALPKSQIITHINDIPMTPDAWVKLMDPVAAPLQSTPQLRLKIFDVRKAVAHEETYTRA